MIFKTFETPVWNGKQNSLTGPVITGCFGKLAPGCLFYRVLAYPLLCVQDLSWTYRSCSTSNFQAASSTSNPLKLSQESWTKLSLVLGEAHPVIIRVRSQLVFPLADESQGELEQTLADVMITYNTPRP